MRTSTRRSLGDRPRPFGGPLARRLPTICLAAILGSGAACHHDVVPTSPMAPTSPDPAVYSDGTWLVNSLADAFGGVCTNSECTLREAIAVAQDGERIVFKSNLSGTIPLVTGLVVDRAITIEGPGADRIALDAQGFGRVFTIAPGPGVTISGLTIKGGYAPNLGGGGISVLAGGRLTLIGVVVAGNAAERGGGIFSEGTLTLVGSTVANNVASGVGGGVHVSNDLTVRRSTISGNSGLQGGGIEAFCDVCTVTIASSTITANSSVDVGGGIFNHAPVLTLFNTIVAGNRAKGSATDPEADCNVSSITTLGYNLTSATTGCDGFVDAPTDVIVAATQVFSTVLWPQLATNGSPRLTHALIERGYAVDAGYCPGESGDQRGFPRPYDDPVMPNALDACDIGAFEWNPTDTKNNPK